MGGYLASREVLTAADRRQTMPAGDIRQMCVSPDLIPVMDVRASLLVLRFGRPFVVFSPSASETLSCWRPQSFCDPPTLPCVLPGEGFLLRSRACAGLLFANTPYIHLVPVLTEKVMSGLDCI